MSDRNVGIIDNESTGNATVQQSRQNQQPVTTAESRIQDSRDPLGANLTWASIKGAWRDLKNY